MSSKKDSPCFSVPELNKTEVEAIRALYSGTASEYEQRLSLTVIINKFSRANDLPYIPGSFDETAFFNGRAFVGQKILKIIKMPIGRLNKAEKNELE